MGIGSGNGNEGSRNEGYENEYPPLSGNGVPIPYHKMANPNTSIWVWGSDSR